MTAAATAHRLEQQLHARGLDLCRWFSVRRYNGLVADTRYHLPVGGASGASAMAGGPYALLVGNTRRLWPLFRAWCSQQSQPLPPHPLNAYVDGAVEEALRAAGVGDALPADAVRVHDVRYAHETSADRLLPIQTAAHAAGLAYYLRAAGLSVHTTFGPWIALRAVVLWDTTSASAASLAEWEEVWRGLDDERKGVAALPECPFTDAQQTELVDRANMLVETCGRFRPSYAGVEEAAPANTVSQMLSAWYAASNSTVPDEALHWIGRVCALNQEPVMAATATAATPTNISVLASCPAPPWLGWLLLRQRAAEMLDIDDEHARYSAEQTAYHYGRRRDLL
ncbi:hypothetical protein THASP1DRAFT_31713 [Thamnocephalis sphaerospora]|uniref:Cyanocobalamin reductase (cyanide-eliminating) n=1 Tax=Thamnocephalis sphaerospora TaxID=78915 RepID=A0A4P9XM82_9FUNG|nr:hypothetical protein THASP1DRAFT_31713 [Thamnocephalis sphaerospora]|eukprot:RKP06471.1 hypothetical protein THASP1DRAFT_31713 [Thamnocephalis sphaerospora]